MPRNGSGVFSLPAGSIVTDGDTAEASQHNTPLQDLANDANAARPVVAGGTGASTAADARTNLGLGTAAVANVQTSATDTTTGRALTVGAFGIGETGATPLLSDLDATDTPTGMYRATTATTGTKPTFNAGTAATVDAYVLVERYSSVAIVQTYKAAGTSGGNSNRVWIRAYNVGLSVWLSWREVYTAASALGTVGQSSGVPTGALIERGSNANGEYVRFADGTQICSHVLTLNTVAASSLSATWTYPAAFSALQVVSAAPDMNTVNSTAPGLTGVGQCAPSNETTTSATIALYRITGLTDFSAGNSAAARCFAFGRWF